MAESIRRNVIRGESLKLYRDILRSSKMFTWPNEVGEPWSQVLRKNARKEFEQARFEMDHKIILRLQYVGRDCLNQTTDKYLAATKTMEDNIHKTRTS